jgi:hypothetical protein
MNDKQINRFINANHDSENSRYKHLIYFDTKNIVLTGYSGKVGMKERNNDIENFINYALRLMKSNYYPGGTREIESIKYYFNREDELITTFRHGYASWEAKFAFDEKWKRAQRVIETMYVLLEKKWSPGQIDDKLRIKSRAKDVFDPNDLTPRYTSDRALMRRCEELTRKGYPPEEIESYILKYRAKYFNKF